MAVTLTIKRVPEELVRKLRRRAARHNRSLQGELLTLLEDALSPRELSVAELHREIQALGLRTPAESVRMIREDRDAR
jgi:plasmid stability protein